MEMFSSLLVLLFIIKLKLKCATNGFECCEPPRFFLSFHLRDFCHYEFCMCTFFVIIEIDLWMNEIGIHSQGKFWLEYIRVLSIRTLFSFKIGHFLYWKIWFLSLPQSREADEIWHYGGQLNVSLEPVCTILL